MSAEAYRGIIFLLTWFSIMEVLAIILLVTTKGPSEMLIGMVALTLFTVALLLLFIYRARKMVLEEIE